MMARVATGLVLAPVAILLTLWSPAWLFAMLVLLIMLAALVEWNRLKPNSMVVLAGILVTILALAAYLFLNPRQLPIVCLAGLLFWAVEAAHFAFKTGPVNTDRIGADSTRPGGGNETGKIPGSLGSLVQGGFIVLFAWSALVFMHRYPEQGPVMAIAMLLVVWSADTFAYFTGKKFGKHKLAPSISPGKTIEGVVGGLIGAGLVSLIMATIVLDLNGSNVLSWLLASLVAALFSVVGDLYESRLKRQAGVKDSGNLLPGHGGILDRIDGLVAATPVFATIWWLLA